MTSKPRFFIRAILSATAFAAAAGAAKANDRYAAISMDLATNEVLFEESADERRFPASLTKMMTLYMLFEALERGDVRLGESLPVSRFASLQAPSKLGLRRGQSIRTEDAIRALVTKSANDVAVVIAERLGGTEAKFASQMTARARALGMENTRFANASGLPDPRQVTTARDLALLSAALFRDFPSYYAYFATRSMRWGRATMNNHNNLLGEVTGLDGIKTGYIRASGFNLASSVERNGQRIVVVVMGGESADVRDREMRYLIESAFEEIALRATQTASLYPSPALRVRVAIDPAADASSAVTFEEGSPDPARAWRIPVRYEELSGIY